MNPRHLSEKEGCLLLIYEVEESILEVAMDNSHKLDITKRLQALFRKEQQASMGHTKTSAHVSKVQYSRKKKHKGKEEV